METFARILAFPLSRKLLQALSRCDVLMKRLTLVTMWEEEHREATVEAGRILEVKCSNPG